MATTARSASSRRYLGRKRSFSHPKPRNVFLKARRIKVKE